MRPKATWESEPELRYAQLAGGRVAYVEAGSGPAVVFVHGYGDCRFSWRHQVPELSRLGRVIALDLPGYGDSDKPRREYTPRFFVESLREFLDVLEIGEAALVGSSMGGAISLGLAVNHPKRVRSLALLGPTTPGAIPTGRVFDLLFYLIRWPWLLRLLLRRPLRASARLMLREAVADPALVTDELVERYYGVMRQPGFAEACVSTAWHWPEWVEYRPRMNKLEQSTLLIWGEHDRVHPLRQSGLLRTLIPAARLLVLPCGHLPQSEMPAEVNRALEEHWRSVL